MPRLLCAPALVLLALSWAVGAADEPAAVTGKGVAGENVPGKVDGEGNLSTADEPKPAAAVDTSKPPRVLFITAKDCPRCERELARLRRPGGDFEKMRARGWKIGPGPTNHLQIVDRLAVGDLIAELATSELPKVICVREQEIVRSFQSGCTTPLDMWTFGWLIKGIDERPPGWVPEKARVEWTGHYPLRGNHWSIDEDWNPTRERVVAHLRSVHGCRFAPIMKSKPGRTRNCARCTIICTSRKWADSTSLARSPRTPSAPSQDHRALAANEK